MGFNRKEEMDIKSVASIILDQIEKFYNDPENLKKFEEWKQNRLNSNSNTTNNCNLIN